MKVGAGFYPRSNLANLIEIKKTYKKHKDELENIKRAQSQSIHSQSLYSPKNKFINLHDSMREAFSYSREYNSRQKMQNILDDNKKIVTKIKDIQKGESNTIPRLLTDVQLKKTQKKRRTKSRRLREEIESISSLLEQEDKLYLDNFNQQIGAVNTQSNDHNKSSQKYINDHSNNQALNSNSKVLLLRKSLNMEHKNEFQRQIAQNNTQLINKIVNVQSSINHKDLEKEFKQNQKYKKNVRKSSKSRQQFLNNFLQSHFQRSNSSCCTPKQEILTIQKSFNQNIKPQLSQNSHMIMDENNQNIQLFNSSDKNIHVQPQNKILQNYDYIEEHELYETKNRISNSQKILKTQTKTESDNIKERGKVAITSEAKTQSNLNIQSHRKHRSHSLKPDSQTVSFSPYQHMIIESEKEQNYRKMQFNVSKNLPPPIPIKKVQEKFKQQSWQRNNNLFQIQPLRSASMLSNNSPSRRIKSSNECTPSIQNFKINTILSPCGHKLRYHNLNIQRPLSQIQNNSYSGKINYTDQSQFIQKSLSLIESDFDEKQESQNDFEYQNLKEMKQNIKSKENSHYQQYCNQIIYDRYDSKQQPQKNNKYQKCQTEQNNESEQKQLDYYSHIETSEQYNDIIFGMPSIDNRKVSKQFNQYQMNNNKSKEQLGERVQTENKNFKLTSNDVFLKSPNQFSSNYQNVTIPIQIKNKYENIDDKEKYLLISSKQKFYIPNVSNQQDQNENQYQVITSQCTEPAMPIQINSSQQFQDISNRISSYSRIQPSASNSYQFTDSRIDKGAHLPPNKGKPLYQKKQNLTYNKIIQNSYTHENK